MKSISIVGSGMAGLLAANVLSARSPLVLESAKSLPNNHNAVLRFKTDVVGMATAIPFRKVKVMKGVADRESGHAILDAVRYSQKTTGRVEYRSIAGDNFSERYIAPQDFISRMASGANIEYGIDFRAYRRRSGEHFISTIPLPILMGILDYNDADMSLYQYTSGWNLRAKIKAPCDFYATMYFPNQFGSVYRASITGDEFIMEGVGNRRDGVGEIMNIARDVARDYFGVAGPYFSDIMHEVEISDSTYQKIGYSGWELREQNKRFIMWASREHNIHSLGRFATWRAGLLLDDLVSDIHAVSRLIDHSDGHYNFIKDNKR